MPSHELRSSLVPYLLEAGLDPDKLVSDRQLLVECLMRYHVIDKRRLELDDIGKGKTVLAKFCCDVHVLKISHTSA